MESYLFISSFHYYLDLSVSRISTKNKILFAQSLRSPRSIRSSFLILLSIKKRKEKKQSNFFLFLNFLRYIHPSFLTKNYIEHSSIMSSTGPDTWQDTSVMLRI